ncbi:MAG: hypothetical protein MHM6MM_004357, partial [Cercozoa sp. M6MM]
MVVATSNTLESAATADATETEVSTSANEEAPEDAMFLRPPRRVVIRSRVACGIATLFVPLVVLSLATHWWLASWLHALSVTLLYIWSTTALARELQLYILQTPAQEKVCGFRHAAFMLAACVCFIFFIALAIPPENSRRQETDEDSTQLKMPSEPHFDYLKGTFPGHSFCQLRWNKLSAAEMALLSVLSYGDRGARRHVHSSKRFGSSINLWMPNCEQEFSQATSPIKTRMRWTEYTCHHPDETATLTVVA